MPEKATAFLLSLEENGIDFLHRGIDEFYSGRTPQPRAYKYAIIHMFSGVLLLFKERLARVRPSLIFKVEDQMGRPGARTVDFHEAVKRLREHGVVLKEPHLILLEEIRQLRNAIEHFKVDLPLSRAKDVIGELTAFAYWFGREELGVSIDEGLSDRATKRFFRLRSIGDRLLEEALADAAEEYAADERYFQKFGERYGQMEPAELAAMADNEPGGEPLDRRSIPCPICATPLLQLEVAVCLNPACREWFRMEPCHSCLDQTFFGRYLCDACASG